MRAEQVGVETAQEALGQDPAHRESWLTLWIERTGGLCLCHPAGTCVTLSGVRQDCDPISGRCRLSPGAAPSPVIPDKLLPPLSCGGIWAVEVGQAGNAPGPPALSRWPPRLPGAAPLLLATLMPGSGPAALGGLSWGLYKFHLLTQATFLCGNLMLLWLKPLSETAGSCPLNSR